VQARENEVAALQKEVERQQREQLGIFEEEEEEVILGELLMWPFSQQSLVQK
jgi:hypothetical protein